MDTVRKKTQVKTPIAGQTTRIEAVILRVAFWLLAFFSIVAVAAIAILRPRDSDAADVPLLLLPIAVSIACVLAFFLARRGRPRLAASLVMAVTYLAIVCYMIVTGLGLHSHTTGLLALLVIVSALLIGHRAGLWASAVVILTVIVMFVLERNGWSIDPATATNLKPLNILVTYCILFSATGAMLYLFSKALHEALHAASEQEQHLRQLIELAPFGYVMHRDDRVLMVNRIAATTAGFDTPERMVGMSIHDLLPVEQREFADARAVAAPSDAPRADSSAEYRFKDNRGRERRVEALTMGLVLSDGPALLTVMRDVTREREATATLAFAKEQAEAASRTKSQFLASMSHEIRTPLNGVLGMADLLQGTTLDDEQRRYCDAIEASGRALRELIGNILDLAKIEAGKVELELEDFELSRLLEDLVTAYRELSSARGNTFRTSFDLPPCVRLTGDSLRLRQVLTNLLGNAIKFTENGWIALGARALEARPGDTRQWVRFTVRDSGVGMNAETVAKLFQPFSQADSSTTRQYGGTGLGLTIVKHLVDLMGGTVEIESSPGAGSEFRVELPFEPGRAPAEAVRPEIPTTRPVTGAPLRVLLVEDNEINQDVARAMLRKAGHRVELAGDGAEAVRKCTQGHFDCVLMDCQMPVMDGFEATRSIRAREAGNNAARTYIVALTANAMAGDRERCLAAGMDDFLAKPFDSASLLATVARSTKRAVPETASAGDPVTFDIVVFEQLVAMDREMPGFLAQLTDRFLEVAPALIAGVAGASNESAKDAERAAHSLKSTSARFGALALARLAAQAEAAAREGHLDSARALAEAMRVEFASVSARLRQQPVLALKARDL